MFSKMLGGRDEAIYPSNELGDELYRAFPDPSKIPAQAIIWFDIYFDDEADADALADDFETRGFEINRDFDEDNGDEDLGPWNVDAQYAIKPEYRLLRAAVDEMLAKVETARGKLASVVISPIDDD